MMLRRLVNGIELLGIMVLVLVMISNIEMIFKQEFLAYTSVVVRVCVVVLCVMIGMALTFTIYKIFRPQTYNYRRLLFGFIILMSGGIVVFTVPSYFYETMAMPIKFWEKVSLFSLPAICIEGGLITIFSELQAKKFGLSKRESRFIGLAFFIYVCSAVTVNFLVLNTVFPIREQIFFYRGLIIIILGTFALLKVSNHNIWQMMHDRNP